jgi:hypothetical protein
MSDDVRQFDPRLMVRGLAWDIGLPVAGYYVLRLLGVADLPALFAAAAVSGLRVVWGVVRERALNPFALVLLLVYGISAVLSLVSGDPHFLLLKNSFVTGAIALAFLISALLGTPLSLAAVQNSQPDRRAEIRREYEDDPAVRRGHRTSSLVWGLGLLTEALVRVPLIYLLPIDVMVGVSEAMLIAAFALLITRNLWYVRRATTRATARSVQPE